MDQSTDITPARIMDGDQLIICASQQDMEGAPYRLMSEAEWFAFQIKHPSLAGYYEAIVPTPAMRKLLPLRTEANAWVIGALCVLLDGLEEIPEEDALTPELMIERAGRRSVIDGDCLTFEQNLQLNALRDALKAAEDPETRFCLALRIGALLHHDIPIRAAFERVLDGRL